MRGGHSLADRSMSVVGKVAIIALAIVGMTALTGCESQCQQQFASLKNGMTRAQVEELLGKPSSKFEPSEEPGATLLSQERWQYGDNLSTLVTGAMYPTGAPDRVWVVYFDDQGLVSSMHPPVWERDE
ncbi:MAG: outer membrane protein assembly factor BamE [Phycisphaerales bacterium]|nr:outer membrane protein assembly factor BamE [Phycisphaerales bacterium]